MMFDIKSLNIGDICISESGLTKYIILNKQQITKNKILIVWKVMENGSAFVHNYLPNENFVFKSVKNQENQINGLDYI